jgi:hypothetical protein
MADIRELWMYIQTHNQIFMLTIICIWDESWLETNASYRPIYNHQQDQIKGMW